MVKINPNYDWGGRFPKDEKSTEHLIYEDMPSNEQRLEYADHPEVKYRNTKEFKRTYQDLRENRWNRKEKQHKANLKKAQNTIKKNRRCSTSQTSGSSE